MAWLYNERVVTIVFQALVVATPLVAIVGVLIQKSFARKITRRARVLWVVLALAGPANFGLWRLYNAIEDSWGLDRVEPLLINFAIFVLLGIAVGLVVRFFLRSES